MFPGVVADLHAGLREASGLVRVGGHLVADEEERRRGAGITQHVDEPIGEGPRSVIEGECHTLLDRAVDRCGGGPGGGTAPGEQENNGGAHADHAPTTHGHAAYPADYARW